METVGRQYAFIKFGKLLSSHRIPAPTVMDNNTTTDRVIQKKRREFSDPNSSANMKKLNDDLQSIHSIMRKTIDDVLDRQNKLDDVSEISKNLASESKKYNWGAKQLSFMVCHRLHAVQCGGC